MKKVLLILIPLLMFAGCLLTKNEKGDKVKVQDKDQVEEKHTGSLVLVEGGTFQMGNTFGDGDGQPVHEVTLSSFYMAETEVTQEQWIAVMKDNPSRFEGDNRPVESVSWFDAIVFCNKLSMMNMRTPIYSVNGKTDPDTWGYTPSWGYSINGEVVMDLEANGYRLPTDAEWEYAARGGKKSKGYKFPGADSLDAVAWYKDNSGNTTHEVATKTPNELGLYDMGGNVWEWVWDWLSPYVYTPQTNPVGASSGSGRVMRGGCLASPDKSCRVIGRFVNYPHEEIYVYGFRIVRSAN
ncbi:MAG: SUMF1/EgtB/PvdO family nonheme iron enzyme [Treponema sp.]|nr:SUMF1/EgtB/PvdO family nonheme iron enzyme [Treponema sp.]MBR7079587.1 SUMF1/EgtB/PvdO family nonheme iron enzyme [Treponema sp.]